MQNKRDGCHGVPGLSSPESVQRLSAPAPLQWDSVQSPQEGACPLGKPAVPRCATHTLTLRVETEGITLDGETGCDSEGTILSVLSCLCLEFMSPALQGTTWSPAHGEQEGSDF